MQLSHYITKNRILDLNGENLKAVLNELLDSICATQTKLSKRSLLKQLIQRENTIATYLGSGVILPHIRVKMRSKYVFAVGRSVEGFEYDGTSGENKIHFVFVLLANENEKDYLQVLASIARALKDSSFVNALVASPTKKDFKTNLIQGFSGIHSQPSTGQNKINKLFFKQAERVAKAGNCSTIFLFADTYEGALEVIPTFENVKTVLITSKPLDIPPVIQKLIPTLRIQAFSPKRFAQLRSAVLIGLGKGLFKFSDRICCVGGQADSNQFDSVVMIDIQREFGSVMSDRGSVLPADVKPEVLERILAIATELTVEGREGQKVGTLFVVGDDEAVEKFTKPLVLNPFYGYKHEDRNILNPFMDETIKEFSSVDGAFILRGDGVILSAGSLIHVPDYDHDLPSGLGARHAAASAISVSTNCIAVVISSSSGQVTLFRKGVMLPLIEKGVGGSF